MRLILLRHDIDICFEIVLLTVNLSWIILLTGLFTTHIHPPKFPLHGQSTTQYYFGSQLHHPVQEVNSHGTLHKRWDRDNVARARVKYSGVTCEYETVCVE